MSKESRKLGQAYRREARKVGEKYQKDLWERLTVFNEAVRLKPRWMPQWLWEKVVGRVIDIKKLDSIITGQDIYAIKKNGGQQASPESSKA